MEDMEVEIKFKEYVERNCVNISELSRKTGIERGRLLRFANCQLKMKANDLKKIVETLCLPADIFF